MTRVPDPENPGEFLIQCEECENLNCEGEPVCGYCGEALPGAALPGCELFVDKTFRGDSLVVIDTAREIIADYSAQGYVLSLRQLYYQFVSRDLIENSDKSYKRLGSLVSDGRDAGLLPWDGIEDRGRAVVPWKIEENLDDLFADLVGDYRVDLWADQDRYVEVWVEKDALSNVVERACRPFRAPFMACKGYLSASEAYRSGKRMKEARENGQKPYVIHLGDHDPSGIDMTRDNKRRLELYSGGKVEVKRIALNRDQIDRYSPPPNPAKITDSRAADYIERHGNTSWELDALEPSVLEAIIASQLRTVVDRDLMDDAKAREAEMHETLRGIGRNWKDIEQLIKDRT